MQTTSQIDESLIAPPAPNPKTWVGIVGVLLALSTPLLQVAMFPFLQANFADETARFLSLLPFWVMSGVVIFLAVKVEGIPLARFGFKRWDKPLRAKLIELILTVSLAFVVAVVMIGASNGLRQLLTGEPAPSPFPERVPSFGLMLAAWVTASFTEELLFRSYAIERLLLLTGNKWLAGTLTVLAFSFLHLTGWDWIHVLTFVLPIAIPVTLIYMWRRSLLTVVIIHGILNAPLLVLPLIAPYM
jgi:membrane protease YdiL (CAAX protease family)